MKAKAKVITRIVIAVLLFVNSILIAKGISPLPINEESIMEWVMYGVTAIDILWVWWKDAPLTKAGITAHDIMKAIKEDGIEILGDLLKKGE